MPTQEAQVFSPSARITKDAHVSSWDEYKEKYDRSINDPRGFWTEIASQFHWETAAHPDKFVQYNFDNSNGPISVKWMEGATTNICYNLLDRNIKRGQGDAVAYYWCV